VLSQSFISYRSHCLVQELEKHIELLVKNHNRELNVETKRLRDVKAELDELQRKYSKLQPHAKVSYLMQLLMLSWNVIQFDVL